MTVKNSGHSESNSEWANVMKNILSTDKPKSKSFVILSRAEKLDPKTEKDSDDDEGPSPSKIAAAALVRNEWQSRGRYKPSCAEDRDREKRMKRIAVRGVVQLFNAVGKQQLSSGKPTQQYRSVSASVKSSFKPVDKKSFFNMLLEKDEKIGGAKSSSDLTNNQATSDTEIKEEELKEDPQDSKWDVLRNDFMMSTKLKDWDRQIDQDT